MFKMNLQSVSYTHLRVQPYPLQLLKKAKQRKLSFTSTRENLDTIRKMVTDSSTHRLRSRRSTHNYD